MKDETYNGWTNRETWAWNLLVSNDQYLQEHFVEVLVAERKARREKFFVETEATMKYVVGDWLQNAFDELIYDFQDNGEVAGCESELVLRREIGSLWRIDWDELGGHYVTMMDEYEGVKV